MHAHMSKIKDSENGNTIHVIYLFYFFINYKTTSQSRQNSVSMFSDRMKIVEYQLSLKLVVLQRKELDEITLCIDFCLKLTIRVTVSRHYSITIWAPGPSIGQNEIRDPWKKQHSCIFLIHTVMLEEYPCVVWTIKGPPGPVPLIYLGASYSMHTSSHLELFIMINYV